MALLARTAGTFKAPVLIPVRQLHLLCQPVTGTDQEPGLHSCHQQLYRRCDLVTKGKQRVIQFGVNDGLITNNRYSASVDPLLVRGRHSGLGPGCSPDRRAQEAILDPTSLSMALCRRCSSRATYNNNILANIRWRYLRQPPPMPTLSGSITTNWWRRPHRYAFRSHIYRSFEQEYYVSDQWKGELSRLTITGYGLRYLYLGVPYEEHGQQIAPNIDLGGAFFQNRLSGRGDRHSATRPPSRLFLLRPGERHSRTSTRPKKLKLRLLAFAFAAYAACRQQDVDPRGLCPGL